MDPVFKYSLQQGRVQKASSLIPENREEDCLMGTCRAGRHKAKVSQDLPTYLEWVSESYYFLKYYLKY